MFWRKFQQKVSDKMQNKEKISDAYKIFEYQ